MKLGVQSIACVAFLLLPLACKATGPKSQLKHEFGNTSRESSIPYLECDQAQVGSSLPKTRQYLRTIANHVMDKNPQTFQGELAPDKFCFGGTRSRDLNAFARVRERTIVFHDGLIEKAETDANVAAIISHELAHVTMRHGYGGTKLESEKIEELRKEIIDKGSDLGKAREELGQVRADHRIRSNRYREAALENAEGVGEALKTLDRKMTKLDNLIFDNDVPCVWGREGEDRRKFVRPGSGSGSGRPVVSGEIEPRRLLGSLTSEFAASCEFEDPQNQAQFKTLRKACRELQNQIKKDLKEAMPSPQVKEIERLEAELKEAQSKVDGLQESISRSEGEIAEIKRENLSEEEAANWKEREADEVGYEFFLRAGFVPGEFSWLFEYGAENAEENRSPGSQGGAQGRGPALHLSGDDSSHSGAQKEKRKVTLTARQKQALERCVEMRQDDIATAEPKRGVMTHPLPCWRIYDVQYLENQKHAPDYERLKKGATTVDMDISPSLSEVKAEIDSRALAPRGPGPR